MDKLKLGKYEFDCRLLLGTGKYSDCETMVQSIVASGTQIVTVALRRFNAEDSSDDLMAPVLQLKSVTLMPNTSGARNAEEAVRLAHLGRELTGSNLLKLEIHPNPHHLLPDPIETYQAAIQLVKSGFTVLPYMPADPVLARRLEDVGCAAVMPLGSAIGSGDGIVTLEMIKIMIADSSVPVIVDAGLRSPAEAAAAMQIGCGAVLVNSAIATADNPVMMASAFAQAVEAGLTGRNAGIMPRSGIANPTSPLTSFLSEVNDEQPSV